MTVFPPTPSISRRRAGLEDGNKISVEIRAVTLKPHGDKVDEGQDNTPGVVTSGFTVQSSSPLATPTETDTMGWRADEQWRPALA